MKFPDSLEKGADKEYEHSYGPESSIFLNSRLDSFFSQVFQAVKQRTAPIDWKFHAESKFTLIDPIFEILGSIFSRQSATSVIQRQNHIFSIKMRCFLL